MGEYADMIGEIYLERSRYLLNIDELLEEMYGKSRGEFTDNIKSGFSRNEVTVCCGTLVDTGEANGIVKKTGEQFSICSNNCRKFIEMAES